MADLRPVGPPVVGPGAIEKVNESQLDIVSGDVQALIERRDPVWEEMVSTEPVRIIKQQAHSGYRPSSTRS